MWSFRWVKSSKKRTNKDKIVGNKEVSYYNKIKGDAEPGQKTQIHTWSSIPAQHGQLDCLRNHEQGPSCLALAWGSTMVGAVLPWDCGPFGGSHFSISPRQKDALNQRAKCFFQREPTKFLISQLFWNKTKRWDKKHLMWQISDQITLVRSYSTPLKSWIPQYLLKVMHLPGLAQSITEP